MEYEKLLEAADSARENAYAPYSGFKVGAALLASSGRVYVGCNVENASFGATCCAERGAVSNAICCGEREFECIAVSGGTGGETFPCGICRQVLSEFSPELKIILRDEDGKINIYKLNELLLNGFKL